MPSKPDIELGTVSFKSRLDEIIKNFRQKWPMYDLPFQPWTKDDEDKGDVSGDTESHENSENDNIKLHKGETERNYKGDQTSTMGSLDLDNGIDIVQQDDSYEVDILIYLPGMWCETFIRFKVLHLP